MKKCNIISIELFIYLNYKLDRRDPAPNVHYFKHWPGGHLPQTHRSGLYPAGNVIKKLIPPTTAPPTTQDPTKHICDDNVDSSVRNRAENRFIRSDRSSH